MVVFVTIVFPERLLRFRRRCQCIHYLRSENFQFAQVRLTSTPPPSFAGVISTDVELTSVKNFRNWRFRRRVRVEPAPGFGDEGISDDDISGIINSAATPSPAKLSVTFEFINSKKPAIPLVKTLLSEIIAPPLESFLRPLVIVIPLMIALPSRN